MSPEYVKELQMTYHDLCSYLQDKYGMALYNYYSSPECKRKNGKVTRTSEGLLCHHICEDRYSNAGDPHVAPIYPFECQKKENLAYCNYIEHLILHLKINVNSCSHFEEAYEINRFFNSEGFILIAKDINTLFMDKGSTQKWRNNCYQSIKNDFEDYVGIMKAVLFFVDINYVGDRKRKIRKNDILPFEIPDITSVVDAIKHKEHHFKYKRIKLVVSKISRWRDLAILDANDYSFSDKEKILLDGSLSKVGYMKCINNSILKFKYSTLAKQYNYESVLQKNIDEMVLLADGSKWGFLEQKLKTDFDNEDIEIAGWLNDSKDIDD